MSGKGTLRRADPNTIQDKFLVGYQGWFSCPGDGKPLDPHHHGWLHWFNYPIPSGGRPNVDLWPDVSEYSPSELFPAPGLKLANGEQAFVFSSRNPRTVQRHFNWMALHGVDGAFLQRFVGQCDIEGNEAIRNQRDEVGDLVREAAEKEGRVYAIMYDVSGVPADKIQRIIQQDWLHLVRRKGILDSPNYLREKGRAVISLWGFGFSDSHHDPATVRAIVNFIRDNTPGGAYVIAGTPAHWRTSVADADSNPAFVNVWLEEFDAISPWTIGRYSTLEEADRFAEEKIKGDAELIRQRNDTFAAGQGGRKVDYIPVVSPGGSGFNLSEGKWGFNGIKRRGGQFLWRQLFNVRRQNVRIIYGAMWDEYDEGTALMPVVQNKRQLPVHDQYKFMALDEDGLDLPPDWYMRICGFAAEGLRSERLIHETFPSKELQDYWGTRPKYEEVASSSGSGPLPDKKDKEGETWEEWDAKSKAKELMDEPPPPPYTLEAMEQPAEQTPARAQSVRAAPVSPPATAPQTDGPVLFSPPFLPPTAPLNTKPSLRVPKQATAVTGPATPSVSQDSRPPNAYSNVSTSGPTRQATIRTTPSVSMLADDFGRQSLTASPSPQLHPSYSRGAARSPSPIANQATKPQVGSCPGASVPSSPYQPVQAPLTATRTGSPTTSGHGYPPSGNPNAQQTSTNTLPGGAPVTTTPGWSQSSWLGQQPQRGSSYQQPASPSQSAYGTYQSAYAPVYNPPASSTSPPPQSYPSALPQTQSPFPSLTTHDAGSRYSSVPLQQSQSYPSYLGSQPPVSPYPSSLHHSPSITGHNPSLQPQSTLSSYGPPPGPSYPGAEPGVGGFSFGIANPQQSYYNPSGPQSQYPPPCQSQYPPQQPGPGQYDQFGPGPGGFAQPGPGGYSYQNQGPGSYAPGQESQVGSTMITSTTDHNNLTSLPQQQQQQRPQQPHTGFGQSGQFGQFQQPPVPGLPAAGAGSPTNPTTTSNNNDNPSLVPSSTNPFGSPPPPFGNSVISGSAMAMGASGGPQGQAVRPPQVPHVSGLQSPPPSQGPSMSAMPGVAGGGGAGNDKSYTTTTTTATPAMTMGGSPQSPQLPQAQATKNSPGMFGTMAGQPPPLQPQPQVPLAGADPRNNYASPAGTVGPRSAPPQLPQAQVGNASGMTTMPAQPQPLQPQPQFQHQQGATQPQAPMAGMTPEQQQQFLQSQQSQMQYQTQTGQNHMTQQQQQQQQQQGGQTPGQQDKTGETTQRYLNNAFGAVRLPPPHPETGKRLVGGLQGSSKYVRDAITDPNTRKKVTDMAQSSSKLFKDGFKDFSKKFK